MVKKFLVALSVVMLAAGGCGTGDSGESDATRIQEQAESGASMSARDRELLQEQQEDAAAAPAAPAE